LKVRELIEVKLEELKTCMNDESQSITCGLKNYMEDKKAIRTAQFEKFSQKTIHKLEILTDLDVSYACYMRNRMILVNDEIRRSFDDLERDIVPNMKHVMTMLNDLRDNVCRCAEYTEKQIEKCREAAVPTKLMECVDEHMDIILMTIEQMRNEMYFKLAEIVKFCEDVIVAHDAAMQELLESNYKKSNELLTCLDENIVKLKKANKKRKRFLTRKCD